MSNCATKTKDSQISFAKHKISIDGIPSEKSWEYAEWRNIDQRWLGPEYSEEDFSGRFKVLWDEFHIYVLAEITDDVLMDQTQDGLE